MLARHLGSLRMFRPYKKVAGSSDVVIQKQGFSTVDTRVPAIATTLLIFSHMSIRSPS